jgi:hypothetical protein
VDGLDGANGLAAVKPLLAPEPHFDTPRFAPLSVIKCISITTQFIITTKNEESNYERCNGLDRCNDDDELLQLEQHR